MAFRETDLTRVLSGADVREDVRSNSVALRWAKVTSLTPLEVRRSGESTDFTVTGSAVPEAMLQVGDTVRVSNFGSKAFVESSPSVMSRLATLQDDLDPGGPFKVLGSDSLSNLAWFNYSSSAEPSTFAVRTSTGNLTVPVTPAGNSSATSKSYVDSTAQLAADNVIDGVGTHLAYRVVSFAPQTFNPGAFVSMDVSHGLGRTPIGVWTDVNTNHGVTGRFFSKTQTYNTTIIRVNLVNVGQTSVTTTANVQVDLLILY